MKLCLFFLMLCGWPACCAYADTVTYHALIDTSCLTGTTGSLDFDFQGGPFNARSAIVQITRFAGGQPSGGAAISDDVSGALPGDLSLGNGGAYNDYFQAFTFGSRLSFDIVLGGPAVGSATPGSGSTLTFSIFSDVGGSVSALSSNPDGFALTADINADGTTTFRSFTPPVTPMSVTPEPSSALLEMTGAMFAIALCWRSCAERV